MFHGSHDDARWAATIYTMLLNCQLQNINPTQWLEDVLVKLKIIPKDCGLTIGNHNRLNSSSCMLSITPFFKHP
jgi:hypothetical protein